MRSPIPQWRPSTAKINKWTNKKWNIFTYQLTIPVGFSISIIPIQTALTELTNDYHPTNLAYQDQWPIICSWVIKTQQALPRVCGVAYLPCFPTTLPSFQYSLTSSDFLRSSASALPSSYIFSQGFKYVLINFDLMLSTHISLLSSRLIWNCHWISPLGYLLHIAD